MGQKSLLIKKLIFFLVICLPAAAQEPDGIESSWDQPERLAGLYVEYRTGTRMLIDRILREPLSARRIHPAGETGLRYNGRLYHRTAPLFYRADNGSSLAFAVTETGPYVFFEEQQRPYRKSFFVADPRISLYPAPFAALILLTATIYILRKFPDRNRKLALYSLAGSVLFAGGVLLELNFYQLVVLEGGFFWPHTVWRVITNLGAIALLVVPMFALSIRRHADFVNGALMPLQALHVMAIGLAGLTLFLLGVYWGVIGEFGRYS